RSVERRGADAFVLRRHVIRELVGVRDAGDQRRTRDAVVAVRGQLGQKLRILGVALDEPVARVVVERAAHPAVLAVVVDADDLVPGAKQLGDQVPADEPGGAGDEDLHPRSSGLTTICGGGGDEFQRRMGPGIPQLSTTWRSPRSRPREARCWAPTTS